MRTTITLPDELAAAVESESHRLGVSGAEVVRRAVTLYLEGGPPATRHLSFVGIGRGGHHDTARRAEEILAREWEAQHQRAGRGGPGRHR